MKPMYKKGGKKPKSFIEDSPKELSFGGMDYKDGGFDLNKDGKTNFSDVLYGRTDGKIGKKKTGGKSMEPGGGGRFAAMVSGLKKKGKSEDSAKAIAASIGRKKYGKSRFQEMAAAGKKKMGGPDDDNKKSTKVGARSEKVMGKAKANWQKAEAIKNYDETEEESNFAQDEFGMNASRKANQLYAKAERQEMRAEKLKKRSEFLKASGRKMGGKK